MKGVGAAEMLLAGPFMLPCGAFVSQRQKSAPCQSCYGRRSCVCAKDTGMACDNGTHFTSNSKRGHAPGRNQRGFVDLGGNRPGFGRAK